MFPDFLCIGAQRSGTSWLYSSLSSHPAVRLPPVKEIHYFDSPDSKPVLYKAFFNRDRNLRYRLQRQLLDGARTTWHSSKRFNVLGWYGHYFLLPHNDNWYANLFRPGLGQISGDITPAYARLDKSTVARIHSLMPNAKIIYLLRDPIERIRSQAAMFYKTDHKVWQYTQTVPDQTLQTIAHSKDNVFRNSDYLQTLDIWEDYYSTSRIYVGFFDQLIENPRELYRDILHFLELPALDEYIPENVGLKVNSSQQRSFHPQIERQIALRLLSDIERLHDRFANQYTAGWLAHAREIIKT